MQYQYAWLWRNLHLVRGFVLMVYIYNSYLTGGINWFNLATSKFIQSSLNDYSLS